MAISFSTSTVLERLSDRYEVHHPIGQPFGYQQLLASDIRTKQPVVIKSLTIEENTPTGDICCFEREIHFLDSLNHPAGKPSPRWRLGVKRLPSQILRRSQSSCYKG